MPARVLFILYISPKPAIKKLFWGVTAMEAITFLPLLLTVPKFKLSYTFAAVSF